MMYDENSSAQLVTLANLMNVKDSRWLQLDVCREFQRGHCSRTEIECKYSHPPPHVEIQNGKVTACYDSIKGRCTRENPKCKYLHPPQHLKEQLIINGRNNLALKNLVISQFGSTPVPALAAASASPLAVSQFALAAGPSIIPGVTAPATYNPYFTYGLNGLNPAAAMYPGLMAASAADPLSSMASLLSAGPLAASPAMLVNSPAMFANASLTLQAQRAAAIAALTSNKSVEKTQICREFARGHCPRHEVDCKYLHTTATSLASSVGGFGSGGGLMTTTTGSTMTAGQIPTTNQSQSYLNSLVSNTNTALDPQQLWQQAMANATNNAMVQQAVARSLSNPLVSPVSCSTTMNGVGSSASMAGKKRALDNGEALPSGFGSVSSIGGSTDSLLMPTGTVNGSTSKRQALDQSDLSHHSQRQAMATGGSVAGTAAASAGNPLQTAALAAMGLSGSSHLPYASHMPYALTSNVCSIPTTHAAAAAAAALFNGAATTTSLPAWAFTGYPAYLSRF